MNAKIVLNEVNMQKIINRLNQKSRKLEKKINELIQERQDLTSEIEFLQVLLSKI